MFFVYFCRANILSLNSISKRVLSKRLSGQPLSRNLHLNCVMFSTNVQQVLKSELVLRTSPLIKAFPDTWRVAGGEVCVLQSFCQFEVYAHVKYGFLLKSIALTCIYTCIQESYLCICNFSHEFYGQMIVMCQLYKLVYFLLFMFHRENTSSICLFQVSGCKWLWLLFLFLLRPWKCWQKRLPFLYPLQYDVFEDNFCR